MRRPSVADRVGGASNPIDALKRLLTYMRPYRIQLIIVAFFIVAYNIFYILGPFLLGVAIDEYIIPGDVPGLGRILLWMLAVYAGMWLSGVIYGRVMAAVAQRTLQRLRKDLFDHMQTLSLGFFDRQSAGDLMSRLTNDMDAINQLLSQNLVSFLSSFFTLAGVLITMFVLNMWLALTALIIIPLMFILMAAIMQRIGPRFRDLQESLGALNGLMEENLAGQRVIIAYGQQGANLDDFEQLNETTRDASVTANVLAGVMAPLMAVLSTLNVAIVVGAGAAMALAGFGGVTIGTIATFADYTRRFGFPLMQIGNLFNSIISALAGAERIFDVLDTQPQVVDQPAAKKLESIKGDVVFEGVDFSYMPNQPILKKIDLNARPGEMIALVGPTGAGKTTIINMLTRFYDIEEGRILVDGQEIRDVQQDSLREQLGIVLQDTYLFSDTVIENIRYGRLDATDEEVFEAARLANADRFIRRLPDGYETMLSERANNISQGQRQLLAIARAILADPRILILDEATSSVDTRTEVQIQGALLNLMAGRTSFVIAHRLSTIREADQILVLKDGEIIERGNHQSLLEQQGFYHNLYLSQFKGTAVAA
ncbi:MAG: ABC transporter ATP-binding protein [Ardenticatenaceae bacterium]|nr:ABC transporter ATP-binding protein [Ardenticatenaceae bacterium]